MADSKPAMYGEQFASAFQERSVVEAYQHRPPYPPQAFEVLCGLIVDSPRRVLDAGCGTGFVARYALDFADAVDAVDVSAAMIEQGKQLPSGDHPKLNWIMGRVEDVRLTPPYALITAGDSLHWMDWEVVMLRFANILSPNGYLAILTVNSLPNPWDDAVQPILQKYSVYGDQFQRVDLIGELKRRGLFQKIDELSTESFVFTQSLDAHIESFHGRAGFPRERMSAQAVREFDQAVREVVSSFVQKDIVELQIVSDITWGKPLR